MTDARRKKCCNSTARSFTWVMGASGGGMGVAHFGKENIRKDTL